ncbi:MAG: long-chain-fatty-acid--CoA ligase [Candidatus Hodarchaeales archaeon]|jgi:long-chain acyl-CoA synthetase
MTTTTILNLASILEGSSREYPEKLAIIFGESRITYSQLNVMANKIAHGLTKSGLGKGDHIALSCPNLPYFPMVYYAILKIGGTVVPLNVLLKRNEIEYHLKDSDAKAYFSFVGTEELPMGEEAWAGFNKVDSCKHFWLITPENMQSPIEGAQTMSELVSDQPTTFEYVVTNPLDTAVILYTSGTTGQPKGAELSHMNMYINAAQSTMLPNQTSDDILLITLPMFHSFGQTVQMNAGIMLGNTLVLVARFDPDAVLAGMEKENVTLFAGVPTMYWGLLNHPEVEKYDLEKISKTLRLGTAGGSAMPVEIMKAFEEKFKITILEGYGLSETSPVACFSRLDKLRKPGSIGVPIHGIQMMIADDNGNPLPTGEVGEVLIRGNNIMKGYYKRPEATAETFTKDGWFKSGDLGKMDEDGYFYITDRKKDMIIRGGFNVYPSELENVLISHPAISLAAVIGVPHDQYGEEVKAFVILNEGHVISPEEIIEWAKNTMAAYKYPRMVIIKENLPMTGSGKLLKRELREM